MSFLMDRQRPTQVPVLGHERHGNKPARANHSPQLRRGGPPIVGRREVIERTEAYDGIELVRSPSAQVAHVRLDSFAHRPRRQVGSSNFQQVRRQVRQRHPEATIG
jgi:hypothetical protein